MGSTSDRAVPGTALPTSAGRGSALGKKVS
jgi:hypothetical protein